MSAPVSMKESDASANSSRLSATARFHTVTPGKCVAIYQEFAMKSRAVAGLSKRLTRTIDSSRNLVRRVAFVTAASAALFGANAAHADSEEALNSCIKSFIASNMAGFGGKVTVHTDHSGYQPFGYGSRSHYEFSVVAYDKADGETLLTATCVAKRDGTVVSLKSEVASTKVAESFGPKIEVLDAG
jgi:hypothetical protein